MAKQANTYTEGGRVYSYGTHVATINHEARTIIAHGKWSSTTSAHVNKTAHELGYSVTQDPKGQAGSEKVSGDTFGAQRQGVVKEDRDKAADGSANPLAAILKAATMFGALASMNPDKEQAQRERERILFATPGIIRPEGWDSLPFAERKRRTDAAYAEASK